MTASLTAQPATWASFFLDLHVLALLDRVEASLDRHRARDASAPPLALGA